MADDQGRRVALSKLSNYPDIDLDKMLRAISLARAPLPKNSSYEDIVSEATAYLHNGATSFERGVISGIILAQLRYMIAE